jgi:hypothetical protein
MLRQGHEGFSSFLAMPLLSPKKTGAKRSPEWPARAPKKRSFDNSTSSATELSYQVLVTMANSLFHPNIQLKTAKKALNRVFAK